MVPFTQESAQLGVSPQSQTYRLGNFREQGQWGQERSLALFFLDIRDFTPLVASRPLPEVMHLLQQLFGIFQESIHANRGTIIETAGDGFYAVFGLEESLPKAANAAVKAGRAILDQLEEVNETYFEPLFHHQFQVGIGLHVGKVIVGQLGLGVNNNRTVMGYAVNIAARLQEATKRLNNSFVLSSEAYGLLSDSPLAVSEQIVLKGITEERQVYLLGHSYQFAPRQESAWKMAC